MPMHVGNWDASAQRAAGELCWDGGSFLDGFPYKVFWSDKAICTIGG